MSGIGGFGVPAGTLAALLGSFVLAAVVSTATVHVAARYVLGDVPLQRALLVGPVVPLSFLVLSPLHPLVVLGGSLLADFAAVHLVYGVSYGAAGMVAAVHYAVSLLLGIAVADVVRVLSASPA